MESLCNLPPPTTMAFEPLNLFFAQEMEALRNRMMMMEEDHRALYWQLKECDGARMEAIEDAEQAEQQVAALSGQADLMGTKIRSQWLLISELRATIAQKNMEIEELSTGVYLRTIRNHPYRRGHYQWQE